MGKSSSGCFAPLDQAGKSSQVIGGHTSELYLQCQILGTWPVAAIYIDRYYYYHYYLLLYNII